MGNLKKYSVLVVDDEEGIRSMISDVLSFEGYNCITAENGKEAFDVVCSMKIDAVISDIRMPELGGVDLLDKVKSRNIAIPHLALISGFSEVSVVDLYDKGMEAFLTKPFQVKAVIDTVKHFLSPIGTLSNKSNIQPFDSILSYTFPSVDFCAKEKQFIIGRGGFFLEASFLKKTYDIGSKIRFSFVFDDPKDPSFIGSGTVRWVRNDSNSGIGVELDFLNEEWQAKLLSDFKYSRTIPFIPKG
jgi:CheY-like chemotaxis protein